MIKIEQISSNAAEELCRMITNNLPEYFGIEEASEQYYTGVKTCINFAAKSGSNDIGLISINFPYPNNANIYWLGVIKDHHRQGVGKKLIQAAIDFAFVKDIETMTVETLAPTEDDQNYLETYDFYKFIGFMPLFNLKPKSYEWNMVYMVKVLR